MKIALLCPTRERPKDVKRLIDSIENTMNSKENFTLYLGVDSDDPTKKEVVKLAKSSPITKVINIKADGTFQGLGKIWNIMAGEVSEEILSMVGDDMVFETKDWDKMVLAEFKKVRDNVLLVHCNDGMRGQGNPFPSHEPFAVNSFVHRLYYKTFGQYVREEWKHGYHDTWLHDVYTLIGRRVYRHDIMLNHLHVSNPNANTEVDAVTDKLNQAYVELSDPQRVYDDLINVRKEEAETLKGLMRNNDNPTLSLLICTMESRTEMFNRLLEKLREQECNDIEIHYELDKGSMSIGDKRNKLLEKCNGEYIAFIDDDDMVSDDYVELILDAIYKSHPDVIGMHLLMTVDGEHEERTYHSLKYDHWWDEPDPDRTGKTRYFRNPNHLNPVKRELAMKVKFPSINEGEDRDYSKKLLEHLKTEEYIESPIYYYLYRSNK